jgi:hypothetical protein
VTATNRPEFPQQLAALAHHLTEHPDLPEIYHVQERLGGGFEIRLMSGEDAHALAVWAATLTGPVTSYAYRYPVDGRRHVDGHVLGQLGGHVFEVTGSLPVDTVPADEGRHEWTVSQ